MGREEFGKVISFSKGFIIMGEWGEKLNIDVGSKELPFLRRKKMMTYL